MLKIYWLLTRYSLSVLGTLFRPSKRYFSSKLSCALRASHRAKMLSADLSSGSPYRPWPPPPPPSKERRPGTSSSCSTTKCSGDEEVRVAVFPLRDEGGRGSDDASATQPEP